MVVWEGVGLGEGGVDGGLTVGFGAGWRTVGAGVGRARDVARFGAAAALCSACSFGLWLGDGLPLALPEAPGLAGPDGLVDGVPACEVVVAAGAEWLNTFINPTAPTALSKVARQVSVESLRRPSSRRKVSRSPCRMGVTKSGIALRVHQERFKGTL